jgi:hypothetical protein
MSDLLGSGLPLIFMSYLTFKVSVWIHYYKWLPFLVKIYYIYTDIMFLLDALQFL